MQNRQQPESQVLLTEYQALRAEVDRRSTIQWNVFALQVTSAGVIASVAITSASHNALALLIPLSSYMLGTRYILHDFHIKLIGCYVRDSLSIRLDNGLEWETWKTEQLTPTTARNRWFTATGWNMLHPTRLAFEGVAELALVAAAAAAIYQWRLQRPFWLIITGLVLMWLLGLCMTYFLHRSFNRASSPTP